MVSVATIPKLQVHRYVTESMPVTVQCLRCCSLDTLYAEVQDGKIISWDFDKNYVVTQRTIWHICGGQCRAFYPGWISKF